MRGKDILGRRNKFKAIKIRKSTASLGTCKWFYVTGNGANLVLPVVMRTCHKGGSR